MQHPQCVETLADSAATPAATAAPRRLNVPVLVFALVAELLVVASCLCVPIFQVPDEPAHLLLAERFSRGALRPVAQGDTAGGEVDAGLTQLVALHHDAGTAGPSAEVMRRSRAIKWRHAYVYAPFSNTARYPPLLYLPQVVGLAVGRALDLSVLHSVLLARLLNGTAAVALIAVAVALCRRGRGLLMLIALLPMTVFELGSAAQDAGIIALSMGVAAGVSRGAELSRRQFGWLAACMALLAMSRPPLIGLIPILWLIGRPGAVESRTRWWAVGLSLTAFAAWFALSMRAGGVLRPGVDPSVRPQLKHLLQHPTQWLSVPLGTVASQWREWMRMFFGVLGWLRIVLPSGVYRALAAALFLSALASTAERPVLRIRHSLAVSGLCFGTLLLMLIATYLTWTPVGLPVVEGMQGRYLTCLAPLLVVALPSPLAPGPRRWTDVCRVLHGAAWGLWAGALWSTGRTLLAAYPLASTYAA